MGQMNEISLASGGSLYSDQNNVMYSFANKLFHHTLMLCNYILKARTFYTWLHNFTYLSNELTFWTLNGFILYYKMTDTHTRAHDHVTAWRRDSRRHSGMRHLHQHTTPGGQCSCQSGLTCLLTFIKLRHSFGPHSWFNSPFYENMASLLWPGAYYDQWLSLSI